MANPLIAQGGLNRLRANTIFSAIPTLNITAPYLAPEGLGLALEGEATTIIKTMTGTVISPEPFQMVTVTAHLLRSQKFSDLWKTQQQTNSFLGECTVRPDSVTLSPYYLYNCAITQVGELVFNGQSAGYGVSFQGYWPINSQAWDQGL